MHLFLQICGVVGFGLFGLMYPELVELRAGSGNVNLLGIITCGLSFAFISTYFIFG